LSNSNPSRRTVLKTAGIAGASLVSHPLQAFTATMEFDRQFVTLLRMPDFVRAIGATEEEIRLDKNGAGRWHGDGVEIAVEVHPDRVSLKLNGNRATRVQLRWWGDLTPIKLFLGDDWERSYGDLEWRGDEPNRTMPWYFMAFDGKRTHGYGVRTQAAAFCFWNADRQGISLWADVRSGGVPVELGERTLTVAEIVCRAGRDGEGPFQATHAFCREMCPNPMLPQKPVYGTNDWNYAYGQNSAELIAGVSGLVSELSPDTENRPYSVIDEGWAMGPFNGNFGHGPWIGNPRFGDMDVFADRLKGLGVRPGIWFRPLTPLPDTPSSWKLSRDPAYLDPTVPEVRSHVGAEIRKLVGWGYELVKHDFTTWDLLGRWGFEMGPSPTQDGWKLHDSSRTNAEVIADLYRDIRDAAGSARLIGCNTVSHLAAGFHDLQRTGDDTSGKSWNRNRRMGVNTLAFRGPQHRAFYNVDPDIVAITKAVPWSLVDQWLTLVSESGVALFVAVEPKIVEPKHRDALKKAFAIAAKTQPTGQAVDWMDSICPRQWNLLGKSTEFAWMGESGGWPFPD
jgi:alpha-galactosidase